MARHAEAPQRHCDTTVATPRRVPTSATQRPLKPAADASDPPPATRHAQAPGTQCDTKARHAQAPGTYCVTKARHAEAPQRHCDTTVATPRRVSTSASQRPLKPAADASDPPPATRHAQAPGTQCDTKARHAEAPQRHCDTTVATPRRVPTSATQRPLKPAADASGPRHNNPTHPDTRNHCDTTTRHAEAVITPETPRTRHAGRVLGAVELVGEVPAVVLKHQTHDAHHQEDDAGEHQPGGEHKAQSDQHAREAHR